MKRYRYETCCIHSTAEWISDMTEHAREVTYRTMRKHCASLREWEWGMGYDRLGLRLCRDPHVSFHKSRYRGKPCYYIDHSRIEYIWTEQDE